MQQFEETVVPDLKAGQRIEHAQAVRHIVKRNVKAVGLLLEARGERGFLARHGQRLDDDVADAKRDVHHAVDENQRRPSQDLVHPVGIPQQRHRHRQGAKRELPTAIRPPGVTPGIAAA